MVSMERTISCLYLSRRHEDLLNNEKMLYGRINSIIKQIEWDIISPLDRKFGNRPVRFPLKGIRMINIEII